MDNLTKILSVSVELFRQYGFKAITTDDIARRAGISKKTLYQHFANKQEIVNESVLWFKHQMTDTCNEMVRDSENAVEAMVKTLAYMDTMYKQINPMAMFEMQRFFPEAYETFRNQLQDKDMGIIRENIEQGIAEGLYREDVHAELMARYRLESSLMILQPNLIVSNRNELLSVSWEIGEHFMYGIMTAKGVKQYLKYKAKYFIQPATV